MCLIKFLQKFVRCATLNAECLSAFTILIFIMSTILPEFILLFDFILQIITDKS